MTAKWLFPTLGYVAALGALGVTSKLALRTLAWQDLILWTTIGYIFTSIALVVLGKAGFSSSSNTWWAIASAALAIGALILLYVALGTGQASKVIPISAAYPAVTLILSAITLGEHVTVARVAGVLLVIGGVVVLTTAK
jgi:bacterial/archaeal transporter family protein